MKIGSHHLNERVLIVAEIGNNHEGNFNQACELVRQAVACGVDAVKFQTFQTRYYVSQTDSERFRRLQGFELTSDQFKKLSDLAHQLGVLFISTPFDLESAERLSDYVDAYKISSGDLNFFPLIENVLLRPQPLIISTGASTTEMVERTVSFIRDRLSPKQISEKLVLLHCVSSYPAAIDQVHLRAIAGLGRFDTTVGYSDHTLGIDVSLLAVAAGARLIEKHFTLDKNQSNFRDHQLSADPAEMAKLVQEIRRIEPILGQLQKNIQPSEAPNVALIRRSIVAARAMKEGTRIGKEDLTWIRPAGGLSPGQETLLVGKSLRRNIQFGERILCEDVIE